MRTKLTPALAAVVFLVTLTAGCTETVSTPSVQTSRVGLAPTLGWSSWSFMRKDPTAAKIKAQAEAMVSSGLASLGYRYINIDDYWYQCPRGEGPNVDRYGRWVTDAARFPSDGSTDGMEVVADYVHKLGLKFGIYVTPGISKQAVARNTEVEGTPYHASDIATAARQDNYNCRGMYGIDYGKPGAQAYTDSWADMLASWGVDYVKLDGITDDNVPDIQAWSAALAQTGRPIRLDITQGSFTITIAPTLQRYANQWVFAPDIECYRCEQGGSSYPLTSWANVSSRFDWVAECQPYGGPGGFNDYDSIEVGNGDNDGLTPDERRTEMSLWAVGASPFILGVDLTNLDPFDLTLLKNADVLAVDQDSIDASRIVDTSTQQVFTKMEANGNAIVGLFSTGSKPAVVSTTASALGMPANSNGYLLDDLWLDRTTETSGSISAKVPPHGVVLYRVESLGGPTVATPSTTLDPGS